MDEYTKLWETVTTDSNLSTYRLRVPGGWIVIVRDGSNSTTNISLVPDPQGLWILET